MIIEELIAEIELRESYLSRTLTIIKRNEDLRNKSYKYSVRAVLKM